MRGRQSPITLGLSTEWGFREDLSLNNLLVMQKFNTQGLGDLPKETWKGGQANKPSPPSPVQSRCFQAPTRTA